jgi:hypothetical protein
MNKIKMKIVGYDSTDSTLLIKFSGDTLEKNIDEYQEHKFSVLEMHENVAISEILKALAQSGLSIAIQQELNEEISRNDTKSSLYKSLIGNEIEYNLEDLFPKQCPSPNQPTTNGLEII